MVRKLFVQKLKASQGWTLSILFAFIFMSCHPQGNIPTKASNNQGSTANPAMVDKAYVYNRFIDPSDLEVDEVQYDWFIAHPTASVPINIGKFVDFNKSVYVLQNTDNTRLEDDCTFFDFVVRDDCVRVLNYDDPTVTTLPANEGTWVFKPGTDEFYQVQAMYHTRISIQRFAEVLEFLESISTLVAFPTFPSDIVNKNSFWFNYVSDTSEDVHTNQLTIYANCKAQASASFQPADLKICLGIDDSKPTFRMVQDPSILYHELGHAYVKIMMNLRNTDDFGTPLPYTSNLGTHTYDEGGAMNEGIADYFSYVITRRTHMGDWGAGKLYKQSRPLTESDPIHALGISDDADEHLSYPDYLHYHPNFPTENHEDVHYAGQITSHFLVRLTEQLKSPSCLSQTHENATNLVISIMGETLAEMGDLSARGNDIVPDGSATSLVNLNPDKSYDWSNIVAPPTYRKFFQIFSKNVKKYLFDAFDNPCTFGFDINSYEKLLDSYGLLLFTHYNNDMSASNTSNTFLSTSTFLFNSTVVTPTAIDEDNRLKTVMIEKDFIKLANEVDNTKVMASVIDSKSIIRGYLENLLYKGNVITPSQGLASVDYNNSNVKISPGEIVGIIPNLLNTSNSTMAGVRILANDWDHMKILDGDSDGENDETQLCIFEDWPLESEGGIASDDGTVVGNCNYITREADDYKKDLSGDYPDDALHPVCVVEYNDEDETRWVSQNEYRNNSNLLLQDTKCLGYSDSGDFNPNECLIRFYKGAQQATMSKIDPQKTYLETLKGNAETAPIYNASAVLLMEVNRWVPPGTTFNCRLRVQFSNCSDCYTDPDSTTTPKDDYRDYQYAGPGPFKILNFKFTVID